MRRISILLTIIVQFLLTNTVSSQNGNGEKITFHPFVQYGIYSITKLQNPELYEYVNSSGDIIGGISLKPNNKFTIGIFVGFENVQAQLINFIPINDEKIKTKYIGSSLKYTYSRNRNFNFYTGLSTLLLQVDKQLTLEKSIVYTYGYDITILGIEYFIYNHLGSFFEIGAGETGFFRFGINF